MVSTLEHSIAIPLEQGLRHYLSGLGVLDVLDSIAIPLEQGLRHTPVRSI